MSDFIPTAVTKVELSSHRCCVRTADTSQAVALTAPNATWGPIQFPPLGDVFFSVMKPVHAVTGTCLSIKSLKYNMSCTSPSWPCRGIILYKTDGVKWIILWSTQMVFCELTSKRCCKGLDFSFSLSPNCWKPTPSKPWKQLNTELDNSPAQSVLFCWLSCFNKQALS